MTIQFLVDANRRNITTLQKLPTFFAEMLKPVNRWIYLIHNRNTKHKVFWKMVKGQLTLHSQEWRDFLDDSTYINVATFHFIRQEEDCYYVTAYNDAGHECNGYNLTLVGYRQRRCLILVEDLHQSPVRNKR